jgi:hypothetical protein
MGDVPFDIIGSLWALDVFFDSREFGVFCVVSPWSGYLACISSTILGDLLGKRKVEYMELHSTSPPFYRTYLSEVWSYN